MKKAINCFQKSEFQGGGRCNVTHACFDTALLVKNYPRGEKELRTIFSKFSTQHTINWFNERGVALKTERDGRIFPESNSSETIINCLMQEAEKAGIAIKMGISIEAISVNEDQSFIIKTNDNKDFIADKIIIATGGSPKEASYDFLKSLGHTIIQPAPSLFTFNIPNNPITQLMGVSVPKVKLAIAGTKLKTEGPLLITHWGMSGPAILKASAWGAKVLSDINYHFTLLINWLPEYSEEQLRILIQEERAQNPAKSLFSGCPFKLPKNLWHYLLEKVDIQNETRWGDLSKKSVNCLIQILLQNEYIVKGKTTFKEEFVTCGGIDLKEIDFKTMQSKIIPNLYFAGEVIDVDGITGGFNFQNAWSTAWVAANNL